MFKSLRFFKIIFWYCSILFSCLPKSFPGYAMGQRAKGRPARSTSGGKREDFGAKCCGALRVDADLWGERCLERNFRWVWASIRAIRVEYVIVCESPKVEWFTPKNGVSHGSFYWTRDPLWDGWPVFHDGFAASPELCRSHDVSLIVYDGMSSSCNNCCCESWLFGLRSTNHQL